MVSIFKGVTFPLYIETITSFLVTLRLIILNFFINYFEFITISFAISYLFIYYKFKVDYMYE